MMSEVNGRYDGQWEEAVALLRDIDRRTEAQQAENQSSHALLKKIETHTGTVATYFQEQNESLIKERGLPLTVFTILLLLFGVYVISDKLENSDLGVKFNLTDGFEITHGGK